MPNLDFEMQLLDIYSAIWGLAFIENALLILLRIFKPANGYEFYNIHFKYGWSYFVLIVTLKVMATYVLLFIDQKWFTFLSISGGILALYALTVVKLFIALIGKQGIKIEKN